MNIIEKIKATYNFKANNVVELCILNGDEDYEKLKVKIFGINKTYSLHYVINMAKKENFGARCLAWYL